MRIALYSLCALLLVSATACQKKAYRQGTVHTGKVLRAMCGNVMVQLTDGSLPGQSGWHDPYDSAQAYDHVFKVANSCTWGGAEVNSIIRFRLVPATPQGCAQCMAYVPVPDTAYSIEIVR